MTSKQLFTKDGSKIPTRALDRIIKKLEYSTRDAGRLGEWPQLLRDVTQYPDVYETHSRKDVKNSPVRIECNTPICEDNLVAYVQFPGENWFLITCIEYGDATPAALSFLISSPKTDWIGEDGHPFGYIVVDGRTGTLLADGLSYEEMKKAIAALENAGVPAYADEGESPGWHNTLDEMLELIKTGRITGG